MNKVETLIKEVELNDKTYAPRLYITAFGRWCVAYTNIFDKKDNLCSVCVEPENIPLRIEDTIDYALNSYVGNARTLDDAIEMINGYIEKLSL